jgi:hypothetical protein
MPTRRPTVADPTHVLVYPGCTVEVTDRDAFARNPLRANPLVMFKAESPDFIAPHNSTGWPDAHLVLDACIRCDPFGFGDLCDHHRDELTEVEG